MKLYVFLSLIFVGTLFSCSDYASMNQEELEKERAELETKQRELETKIKKIQGFIDKLDTNDKIEPIDVRVTKAEKTTFQSFVEVHGSVETGGNVLIMPEINGIIKKINIKEGQRVKKGQALAFIDTDILYQNLKELKTSLELADDLYEKQKSLYDQNIIPEVQYLEAKNRKDGLEQSIKTIQTQISKGVISAPISGVVQQIIPKTGEMASVQSPFARIIDVTEQVYLESEVSEAFYEKVKVGSIVSVSFPTLGKNNLEGEIFYKGSFIDPGNRTFTIHVSLPKGKGEFPPNLMGVVRLAVDSDDEVISVLTNLIQTDEGVPYLFVVTGKKEKVANKVQVKRGITSGDRTIIKEGLEPGDLIVTQAKMSKLKGLGEDVPVKLK